MIFRLDFWSMHKEKLAVSADGFAYFKSARERVKAEPLGLVQGLSSGSVPWVRKCGCWTLVVSTALGSCK